MSGNKIVWSVTSYYYIIYNTCQRFFCWVCTSMHRLQRITFPGPPALLIYWPVRPQGHPEWQMSVTQRQLNYTSDSHCLGWVVGGRGEQLATGLLASVCASGDAGRLWDSTVFVPGQKSFTWHSSAEEQHAQMLDLWKEISVSRVLALMGCKTTHKSGDE